MTRMTWSAPEARHFDTGLDRGVLYPKKANSLGRLVATNLIYDPPAVVTVPGGASDNDSYFSIDGDAGALRMGLQQGKTYTIMATGTTPVAQTGVLNPRARMLVVYTKVDPNPYVIHQSRQLPETGTDRVRVTFTVPYGATEAFIRLYNGAQGPGQTVQWSKFALFEGNKALPYFDGDTPSTDVYSYEWFGTPHASPSIQREIPNMAIPWIGLTGVDENGAEASTAYYIDGQPFLFLPKPKPYQATLKAYTYPDEFAEIMGLVEATDGMYLDSQMGTAFDLCYRTLVGNAVEGIDHGYKIHLIYNATVAPQGTSYGTMDGNVNPIEFSWEIEAVPRNIPGYLPTAHIVIDTRHMDKFKLQQIESLLYGDESRHPAMPDPAAILDLLSYGDTLTIIDHGDGTWEVRGSYANIQLADDGSFVLNGLYSANYGNGAYIISTDPIVTEEIGITEFIEEPINY